MLSCKTVTQLLRIPLNRYLANHSFLFKVGIRADANVTISEFSPITGFVLSSYNKATLWGLGALTCGCIKIGYPEESLTS